MREGCVAGYAVYSPSGDSPSLNDSHKDKLRLRRRDRSDRGPAAVPDSVLFSGEVLLSSSDSCGFW